MKGACSFSLFLFQNDCTNHPYVWWIKARNVFVRATVCVLHMFVQRSFEFTMRTLHVRNANRISNRERIWISKTFMAHSLICEWNRIACKSLLFCKMDHFLFLFLSLSPDGLSVASILHSFMYHICIYMYNAEKYQPAPDLICNEFSIEFHILLNYIPIAFQWKEKLVFVIIETCYFNLLHINNTGSIFHALMNIFRNSTQITNSFRNPCELCAILPNLYGCRFPNVFRLPFQYTPTIMTIY